MVQDSLLYDSLENRPLPKWLTDQKDGLNTYQPQKIIMKEDNSISISIGVTAVFIMITLVLLTVLVLKKTKNKKKK